MEPGKVWPAQTSAPSQRSSPRTGLDREIGSDRGGVRQAVIVLTDVAHFRFDGAAGFIDEGAGGCGLRDPQGVPLG